MTSSLITATRLSASCPKAGQVLLDLDFSLEPGLIHGLIGPNGAGKTTLLRVLAGQLQHDGEVRVFGTDPFDNPGVMDRTVLAGIDAPLPDAWSLKKLLAVGAARYIGWDGDRAQELAERFELPGRKAYSALSRGQKSAAALVLAVASGCGLLLLDEPYLGLDVEKREEFYRLLREETVRSNRTIVLSTHHLHESEKLLDTVLYLEEGRVHLNGAIQEMSEQILEVFGSAEEVDRLLSRLGPVPELQREEIPVGRRSVIDLRQQPVLADAAYDLPPAWRAIAGFRDHAGTGCIGYERGTTMNRTANELKLFGHLALTPYLLIMFAFGIGMAVMITLTPDGWQRWFFLLVLLVYLLNTSPDFRDYQAVDLSRVHWSRHKQALLAVFALMLLVTTGVVGAISAAGIDWVLVAGVVAVLAYRLIRRPRPTEPWMGTSRTRAEAKDDGAGGGLPMTPVNQIIRAPQGKTWVGLWASFLVAILGIDLVAGLFAEPDPLRIVFVAVAMALFVGFQMMKTVGQSLENWIRIGGGRRRWAHETALLGLIGPAMVGIDGGLYAWLAGTGPAATTVVTLSITALTVPVLAVLLELSGRNSNWWITLIFCAATVLFLVLLARGDADAVRTIGLAALQYLAFALLLPTVVKRHVVFAGGLRSWLGLRTGRG